MSDSGGLRSGEDRRAKDSDSLRLRAMGASITCDDLEQSGKFYTEGLLFTVKERWEHEGKLVGLELVAGNAFLWLMQDDWAKGRDRTKGVGLRLFAETAQNPEELASKFRANGIEVEGPVNHGGNITINMVDPNGIKLAFFKKIDESASD